MQDYRGLKRHHLNGPTGISYICTVEAVEARVDVSPVAAAAAAANISRGRL